MKDKRFSVRRRAIQPFLVALVGVPLMAAMYDFLTGANLFTAFGELIYPAELDPFEPRDLVWASFFGLVGSTALVWGLRELLFPRRILTIDESGLEIGLGGPFRGSVRVPWQDIDDLRLGTLAEHGTERSALVLTIFDRGLLPEHPWAARWTDDFTLAIDVSGWDRTPAEVLTEFDSARRVGMVTGSTSLLGDQAAEE